MCHIFSRHFQLMMFICFLNAVVPSLRPSLFSTTESDKRVKIGLPEPSGNKRRKCKKIHFLFVILRVNTLLNPSKLLKMFIF